MKTTAAPDRKAFGTNPDPMTPRSAWEWSSSDPAPARWEYKSVLLDRDADLTPWGKDGWELVAVIQQALDQAMFYFRRRA